MEPTTIAAAAAVRLTLRHPFWIEVFYSMTVRETTPEEATIIKTEATDGRNLWINPTFFKSIPLDQQVAELVHEIGHKILLHPARRGSREPYLWNVACDFVINAMMKSNGFVIPNDWLLDMQYDGWLAEAVYADLIKKRREQPKQGKGKGDGAGQSGRQPGDPQLADGREDLRDVGGTPEERERYEQEVKALVDRAIATAKAMGKLPAGIEAGTVAAYRSAREPWYNHLHRYMQALSSGEYNWARMNRRSLYTHGVFAPSHLSEALGEVYVFIDTSGSCYDKAQQINFAGHLNAILAEAKPRRVHLLYFDAAVYPGEEIEAGEIDITLKPKGGGGTSFVPIFEQIEKDGVVPAVCIILTDLCGTFPSSGPDYPVVWASILDATAPFGEVIYVSD